MGREKAGRPTRLSRAETEAVNADDGPHLSVEERERRGSGRRLRIRRPGAARTPSLGGDLFLAAETNGRRPEAVVRRSIAVRLSRGRRDARLVEEAWLEGARPQLPPVLAEGASKSELDGLHGGCQSRRRRRGPPMEETPQGDVYQPPEGKTKPGRTWRG